VELVAESVPVELNGRGYRGSLRVSSERGKLRIVNVVDVEGYVCGVVPCEVVPSWSAEALKAQAVAARSYALVKMEKTAAQPYDVVATVYDQKYGGLDVETAATNAAVAATAGQVLYYRGQPFTAWYHACCGGATADAAQVFNEPSPPQRGSPCGYCSKAPVYRWTTRMKGADVAARLGVRDLVGLSTQGVGLDGRVAQVVVHRAAGTTLPVTGLRFRERLGLRSTRFEIKADGDCFVFEGRGWGHGVGMCQWGARGMADAGKAYAEILAHYYRGAEITQAY